MTDMAADHDSLVRRVRALEDQEALRALMIRGWRALDRKDWRTWSACWAEDAVVEFGPWEAIHGREAIRARVEEAESPYANMQHHLLNTHFEVAGDRATGIGYMWFVAVTAPSTPPPLRHGRSVRLGVPPGPGRLARGPPTTRRLVDRGEDTLKSFT
ncbi:nuclear transport factor 2 family protein [Streptomyces sp. M19]